jgi:hypothetical protein
MGSLMDTLLVSMMIKPIYVKQFAKRWYLVWSDTGRTIASFASEFEAYSARRSMIEYNKTGGNQ